MRRRVRSPHLPMIRRAGVGLLVAALAVLAGCRASTTRRLDADEVPLPALSLSRDELLSRLERLGGAIDTIRAAVTYEASVALASDEQRTYRETDGALVAVRPALLRMRGNVPLVSTVAFDMSADAERFRLSIPPRDEFFTGRNEARFEHENPMVNLRPQHILSALFVDVRPYLESDDYATVVTQVPEGIRSYYVVEFIRLAGRDAFVVERLFVDRFDLQLARKRQFNEDGELELNVEYSGHRDVDGIPFPGEVFIERPLEDYSLRIEFHEPGLNLPLDPALFDLPIPDGVTVTVLEDEDDLTVNDETLQTDGDAVTAVPE